MKLRLLATLILLAVAGSSAVAQQHQTQVNNSSAPTTSAQSASRDATREKMRAVLAETGPKINVAFRQSDKQPYNFVGLMTGLTNADSLEIVILISDQDTIHFRIFPKYKGSYVNVDKASNSAGLLRLMSRLSDKNFLYWGADDSFDVFAGYNFTLESGFPAESVKVVLNSIKALDQYVGQMRSSLD